MTVEIVVTKQSATCKTLFHLKAKGKLSQTHKVIHNINFTFWQFLNNFNFPLFSSIICILWFFHDR